jgi:D-glycero-D-manno-heptose 1,7-bisphosphate phosphatase
VNRAVFLDRDGVINQAAPEGEYISTWREMTLLPGVLPAARELRDAGFLIFIVTNQRGLARLKVKAEELGKIHSNLLHLFSSAGATITKIYVCPHESGCECRKPAPGLLLLAAKEHQIDLKASWMVGDSASDVEAGKRAGCRAARILREALEEVPALCPDIQAKDLPAVVKLILKAAV